MDHEYRIARLENKNEELRELIQELNRRIKLLENNDQWLSLSEVARRLGLSRYYVKARLDNFREEIDYKIINRKILINSQIINQI
jgi:biotin operon repressor